RSNSRTAPRRRGWPTAWRATLGALPTVAGDTMAAQEREAPAGGDPRSASARVGRATLVRHYIGGVRDLEPPGADHFPESRGRGIRERIGCVPLLARWVAEGSGGETAWTRGINCGLTGSWASSARRACSWPWR